VRPDGLGFEMKRDHAGNVASARGKPQLRARHAVAMEVVTSKSQFERKDTAAYQTWVQRALSRTRSHDGRED